MRTKSLTYSYSPFHIRSAAVGVVMIVARIDHDLGGVGLNSAVETPVRRAGAAGRRRRKSRRRRVIVGRTTELLLL